MPRDHLDPKQEYASPQEMIVENPLRRLRFHWCALLRQKFLQEGKTIFFNDCSNRQQLQFVH
jgi:hypothetical protein